MKYVLLLLLLLLLISSQSFANSIPISEVRKAIALQPNAGAVACKDKPEEQCMNFTGVDWESAELKEIMKPITQCGLNEAGEQICTVIGEEPTGSFELKVNEAKRLAKEARLKAEADGKKAKDKEISDLLKKTSALTTAEITKILKAKFGE